MKVLMFGWEFPPQITGGLGTACYGITKSLAKSHVKVLFVVPKLFGNEDMRYTTLQDAGEIPSKFIKTDVQEFWRNVRYKEVAAILFPYSSPSEYQENLEKEMRISKPGTSGANHYFEPFSGSYGMDLWKEVDRYSKVTSILAEREKYDIIHAHEWMTFPAAISAKKISGKPLIVHIHATEFDRKGTNIDKTIYDIEKRGMESSDKVITVSNFTRDIVIKNYGIRPGKIVAIHNAVDKRSLSSKIKPERNRDEKIVTFLGRITFQKGPEYFIKAAYKVLQEVRNVRFVLAGSGDLNDKIIRQVHDLGISSKVTLTGFLNNVDVRKLLSRTDVYVMPSVSEPFGISPLEALLSEVPVIISKQSGVSEVIKHAIKVDYWDVNALSDAIYGVLNYKTLSDTLSSDGGKEANNLKWEKTGKQILDVYKSLA